MQNFIDLTTEDSGYQTPVSDNTNFRINARNFSLTYPQCRALRETALEYLKKLAPKGILIAQESHMDGAPHLHVLIQFSNKKNIKNNKYFDFLNYHPNIQATKNVKAWMEYITKDDKNTLSWGSLVTKLGWKNVLAIDNKDDFMETIAQIAPRDYILSHERIEYFVSKKFKPTITYQPKPDETIFKIPFELEMWLDSMFCVGSRPITLVLSGTTRYGKTNWARSLGPHMYFNSQFNMDDWDDEAKYMVLDDMKFEFIPSRKALWGAQQQFVITDKYRHKRTVQWGKQLIFICNDLPAFTEDVLFYNENTFHVDIKEKLF
jgi:hypothetical protein